jgi:hypothetical protein
VEIIFGVASPLAGHQTVQEQLGGQQQQQQQQQQWL